MKYPYLNDSTFLKNFDLQKVKEQTVKIIVLSFNEEKPIEEIQGKITGGSITIAGNSAVRRTGNLSMVADTAKNIKELKSSLSINKKIRIEIGFTNITKEYINYKTLWFPLGTFIIASPSISHSTSGLNISLQLKDKMALLNGDVGGVLPASIIFDKWDTLAPDGSIITTKYTIFKIIQELVNHWGGEQLGKIIISDIDNRVKNVVRWTGKQNLYLTNEEASLTKDMLEEGSYKTIKNGTDIGFVYSDFYYPKDLTVNAGTTITSVLDTIKNFLGNFEYFYDLDGNFRFQEIKNYLNTSQATVKINQLKNSDYLIDNNKGKSIYIFEDNTLFTSVSNNPQYNMIKNDFVVWGQRSTSTGTKIPVRYHLAIDKKPTELTNHEGFIFIDKTDHIQKFKVPIAVAAMEDLPIPGTEELYYRVGDENIIRTWDANKQEYIILKQYIKDEKTGFYKESDENVTMTFDNKATDWRSELYYRDAESEVLADASNYYGAELKSEWAKIYDLKNKKFYDEIVEQPEDIDFYLDIIDTNSAIGEFSVDNIGRRSKVVNDNSINCVFEPVIPEIFFIEEGDEEGRSECESRRNKYIIVSKEIFDNISKGGTFNSAYNAVRDLLYQYTSYNETIQISSIPIYYLEPNVRITVRDIDSDVFGDFIINNITIPLDISGTMSLSCTRALEKI